MTSAAESWPLYVLQSGAGDPPWNMALDEALLVEARNRGAPLLRFYEWTQPAATFGYSQPYRIVEGKTALRPLIRRPTGGGIVPHDRDWTYSLILPPTHPWYQLRAVQSYGAMHAWIVEALHRLGIATELAASAHRPLPGQCFAGHEALDVLWYGRKIAGAAQRRNKLGLLIQGSVQPPEPARRPSWIEALTSSSPKEFFGDVVSFEPRSEELTLARDLVSMKYGRLEYNSGR